MIVIGVDPGNTTGIFRCSTEHPYLPVWIEVSAMSVGVTLRSLLEYGQPMHTVLAYERFDIDANTHKKTRQPAAQEVIGVVKDVCNELRVPCVSQGRSDAKSFGKNKLLKTLGWYRAGMRHANDAARQAALILATRHVREFDRLIP